MITTVVVLTGAGFGLIVLGRRWFGHSSAPQGPAAQWTEDHL